MIAESTSCFLHLLINERTGYSHRKIISIHKI